MEQLFGWHFDNLFPNENDNSDYIQNDNSDYIQNIIYYECCGLQIHGENFIETDITDGYWWHDGKILINEEETSTCPNCGR